MAYDLNTIFALKGLKENREVADSSLAIAADPFLSTPAFKQFEVFRKLKQQVMDGGTINTDSLVTSNPEFYNAYLLAGDYLYKQEKYVLALQNYKVALTKVVATKKEVIYIQEQIKKINKKLAP